MRRNASVISPWVADVLEAVVSISLGHAVAVIDANLERGLDFHLRVDFPKTHCHKDKYKSNNEA